MTKEQINAWLIEYVNPNGMPGDFTPSEVVAILEEFQRTPSLNAGSLEEAAKKYSDKIVPHKEIIIERTRCENVWLDVHEAFLAGASYVKGGEEKGLTKEEIAQICEMADNDYAAQESITFLEWVRKEGWQWSELNSRWFKYGSDDYLNETQLHEKFKERDVTEEHKSDREPGDNDSQPIRSL